MGERGGFVFFVMSYVEGETLGERLRTRGPLPPAEAARVLREVAWALAYAHGRGIVHRDVKPDNILLEAGTGRALVSDFGIASGGGAAGPDTDPGRRMGTAHFMSPEQAAGLPVDGRSDLYGLGVVGYLAVSGRLPFEVGDPAGAAGAAGGRSGARGGGAGARAAAIAGAGHRPVPGPRPRRPPRRRRGAGGGAGPAPETRPALPPTLRAWLGARNPLLVPYLGWAGMFGTLTLANLIAWVTGNRPDGPADIVFLAAIAAAPLLPVVGYHLNQARRQFRAGHTLADLRAALEVARRERAEREAVSREAEEPVGHRLLRAATVASATWGAVTLGLLLAEVVHERTMGARWIVLPLLSTLLFSAVSNALDVQFIPDRLRRWWQTGVRERLWHSRVGEWLARRLGAPERSRAVGGGVFRATEVALGVAASELFAALPAATRAQLAGLPATVAALEARAQEARAELEQLAARARAGDAAVLAARQRAAQAYLADSVAALEGVRLDLLRLHANASDLAPLTTLLEAARQLGEEAGRLADAQREVDDATRR
ncbi:MAG: serine/threonine protein kinase [Gemmatimonadetes bacterium]|nr:serine/threonine protein kinase [Gemmatimonadota bacterium]